MLVRATMERVLLVGLDEPEVRDLRSRLDGIPTLACPLLPRIVIERGRLLVERPHTDEVFVPVSRVVYHGIFEHDFEFVTALALWGGPCLPRARGLMDGRQRIAGLVRVLEVTRFGAMLRGYADRGAPVEAGERSTLVAKWGEWHCGENKARFTGLRRADEPTLIEPFVVGQAMRVHVLGERAWQIRMAGSSWLESIHDPGARVLSEAESDPALIEDARRIGAAIGLEMFAIDYMVEPDGTRHLLELNVVPNVTVFAELREAYLDFAAAWLRGDPP